jgi:hypothetical protein
MIKASMSWAVFAVVLFLGEGDTSMVGDLEVWDIVFEV